MSITTIPESTDVELDSSAPGTRTETVGVRQGGWFVRITILIVVAMFGGLIVLTQGTAVAPFIYTLF